MLNLQLQEVEAMNTGKKIKLIRTFRGLTQKELGEACGIHEVAIRKYELGKNIPKPEQLRKIAEALNVMETYYHYFLRLMKCLMCLLETLMENPECSFPTKVSFSF